MAHDRTRGTVHGRRQQQMGVLEYKRLLEEVPGAIQGEYTVKSRGIDPKADKVHRSGSDELPSR